MWSASGRWTSQEFMWNVYFGGLRPVDLENMPEDADNHSVMRSPSPLRDASSSKSPERLIIANDSKGSYDNRSSPSKTAVKVEEEEKIQEYLQRSDTAVIYAEPVANSKDPTVSSSQTEKSFPPAASKNDEEKSNDEYLLKCPHCDRIFTGRDAVRGLTEHLGEVHKDLSPSTPRRTSSKNCHPCTKCSATFLDKESLAKHKLFHATNGQNSGVTTTSNSNDTSALRKFRCPECSKAFKFKHHLKEHIRIHSGEKPFLCQNCGKRFSHSGSYSSHMTSKKCLVVNLKVRKVDARSPRGRGSTNNPFRPIIPKFGSRAPVGSELSLVPAGFVSSSDRFPTFLSPNRPSYMPLTFHPLLTNTPPFMPVGSFAEVTQLLQNRLENETTLSKEEHSSSQSQASHSSTDEKCDEHPHTELNAVKKILEIVDATVKQQSHPPEKTKNGLLSELLKSAPQSSVKELVCNDFRCKYCCKCFDNKIEVLQHERYLCPLSSEMHMLDTEVKQEILSETNEDKKPRVFTNGERAHYEVNPRPKKSDVIQLSQNLKCPSRAVQAWFHCQQQDCRERNGNSSPHSPSMQSVPVVSHYNDNSPNCTTPVVAYAHGPELSLNFKESNDQPLDLSIRTKKREEIHLNSDATMSLPADSQVLNLSQKSSRVSTPPREPNRYSLYRPHLFEYSNGESNPLPNLQSSLLYKYMHLGLSASMRSPNQSEGLTFNPPLAAVTPTSPEKSPTHINRTLPSPDAASSADNCCSPSGTMESYGQIQRDDNNDGEELSPSPAKKLRIWNQGEDESTLDGSPEPEEDSSGGSTKMRKSWKIHKVESEEGLYACDQCDKMFSKQSSLARHKYEHSGQRPHKCDVCNKAFKHKHHLTEHKRLHSGEKPFQCKKCLKRFSHSGSYSQHMNHRYSYCKPYHE